MSPVFAPLDDFDRADGPLGPDWLDFSTVTPMTIEGGSVVPGFFFNGAAYIPGAAGGFALNISNPGSPQVRLGASIGDIYVQEGTARIWPGYYVTWGSSLCTILQIEVGGVDPDIEHPPWEGTPVAVQTELASAPMGVPVGAVQLAIFVDDHDIVTAYIDGVPVLSAAGLGGLGIGGPDDPPHVAFFLANAAAGSAGLYVELPVVLGGISLNHGLTNALFDGPPGIPAIPGVSLNAKILDGP